MQSRILGTTMPVIEFALDPNESVISEAGELSWMTSSIQMTTHTQFGGGGGIFGVLKRVAGGGSLFMTEYRAMGRPWRDFLRHKTAGPYCADRSWPGTRIHDSPARIFVRDAADSDQRRLPAIAGGRNFRRRRLPAAARQRNGDRMDRAFG
jgi:hypothetical protein